VFNYGEFELFSGSFLLLNELGIETGVLNEQGVKNTNLLNTVLLF
jgi:hypothetical protein